MSETEPFRAKTSETRRVSAIDCGTNSIRLIVADVGPDSTGAPYAIDVHRDMVITRLGEGVDRTGLLDADALKRTLDVAREYSQVIEATGAEPPRVVATSASRDAENSDQFVSGMVDTTGVAPAVISGSEEAELSYLGAVSSLPEDAQPPFLVVDIGGGSTEFILGDGQTRQSVSSNMGSVRVTERFGGEPWTGEKLAAATDWIDERLDEVEQTVDLGAANTVVGVAGTVTTIAAFLAGVTQYDPEVTHGFSPTYDRWQEGIDFMVNAPVGEKDALPIMPAGRGDVIGGGALIWSEVLKRIASLRGGDLPVVVTSEHDILDGLALSQV